MIAAPSRGFVFLAMPKAASTAVEHSFARYGEVLMRGRPTFKHINYAGFHRQVRPLLRSRGFDRDSYEVVCLFREPLDWLASWWRYRSRPELLDPEQRSHHNYTGGVSFDEFAVAYMDRSEPWAQLGRPAKFVRQPNGTIGVDRIYRLEDLNELLTWLHRRVGKEVVVEPTNVSPQRPIELSESTRERLMAHLAAEYEIYNDFTVGHRTSSVPTVSL